MSVWPQWHENKPFALVLLLIGAYTIVLLNAKIHLTMNQADEVGEPQPSEHTITVEGQGKITGRPDIATVTLGIDTKAETVETAQTENTATTNALLEKIKALGVSADDIQTSSYNAYENNEWNPETQEYTSKGWVVSQMITVKVRDTAKIATVLDTAGKSGVTNISGPNFTIDDPSSLKAAAREDAIADAHAKAKDIADALGVRVEEVVGYSEYTDGDSYPPYYADYDSVKSYGGTMPSIEPGTNESMLTVSITYALVD